MHFNFRRLSLTGTGTVKSLQLDLSPAALGNTCSPPHSPVTPTLPSSPTSSSPPVSPRVAALVADGAGSTKIKRTDNRLRRLSVILKRNNSTKRTSGDYSSATISIPTTPTEPTCESPRIVAVTPKVEKAVAAPTPCFIEVADSKPSDSIRAKRRHSRMEQVDQRLFVIEEQQHATDKMIKAQQALFSLGTTSEEPEFETQDEEPDNTPLADSQWVKSTISVFSLEQPHVFETFYELLEPLGSGNFSTVYRARRTLDGVIFAVKKINKKVLAGKEDLIRAEIDIHSALDHPNIIKVVEVFETPDEWNIVLQLADGGELFEYLIENGAQGERRGKELARSILKGVSFFHKKGVVHRDLKPENILLHEQDATEVYIADFGLSTRISPGEVLTKQCGSLEYAAPELLAGKGYDTKADMWSVGVIIFTLIAGYQPFQNSEDSRVLRTILAGKYEFHESHWCFISEDAKDLVKKLLTVDPKKRLSAQDALKHPWFN